MEYNKLFDHTLLAANATNEDVRKLCKEAREYDFMSVCVNPFYVPVAKRLLKGSDVKVCTVIGFPLGQMSPYAKVEEAKDAVKMGAEEVDMVLNVAMVKEGEYRFVEQEIRDVKQAIGKVTLKVILEICYLTDEEIELASKAAKRAGAQFVKTSTGFGKGGATASAIEIMRKAVGEEMGVKASGGIHTAGEMLAMVKAGANRIGCSKSVQIMEELKANA